MSRSLIVLILASMVTVAASAMVSVGLSHAQAMRENAGFMGSMGHHMGQDNHMDCDESMLTHMNVTQYMQGDIHSGCDEMHDHMNMTEYMSCLH
jgi:hypothetical protein